MKIFSIVNFALLLLLCVAKGDDLRDKRQINSIPLVYPYGAIYKLLLGFMVPVKNKEEINLLFSANFQYQYQQYQNISQLSRYYFIKTVSREERKLDLMSRRNERLVFYKAAAEMMTARGMNGQECMLRAICEAAQFPVEEEGFVGEILHILLTPDYGRSDFDDDEEDEDISIYKDAAVAGRQMFSCPHVYKDCPAGNGVMEFISTLSDD